MSKTRSIIEKRLLEKKPDPIKDAEVDKEESPFEKTFHKIKEKIEKKPATVRIKLYRQLLDLMVIPLSAAGANRNKLAVIAREFLRDFEKHSRG